MRSLVRSFGLYFFSLLIFNRFYHIPKTNGFYMNSLSHSCSHQCEKFLRRQNAVQSYGSDELIVFHSDFFQLLCSVYNRELFIEDYEKKNNKTGYMTSRCIIAINPSGGILERE